MATENRKAEYGDLGLERLCECGYPRRLHGKALTASCENYKAASDICDDSKLLHLIQLAVCDPVEAVQGNMPSPAKAVEVIIDRVHQAGIKVADMTMEVAYAKGREENALEQADKYWKRVEAVEAELNASANQVADLTAELQQFWNLTYVQNFECREAILKAELAHQKANVAEMHRDCMRAEERVRGLALRLSEDSSQSSEARRGVEGAHEGTTADKSGASPELLPTQLPLDE